MEPDQIGAAVVFGVEVGFSEATGFFKESKGRGYWMTTLNECSCPSFMYRGGPCKHQKRLAEELQKRAAGPSLPAGVVPLSSEDLEARRRRIAERNAKRAEEKARAPKPSTATKGFNLPEEVRA
ncbi:MAG: SWIM zinc finger domain-containing protein [Synergistales bacterium]|nr:SWIM zinc finger domain-containing protein [Synergistales bacterium]